MKTEYIKRIPALIKPFPGRFWKWYKSQYKGRPWYRKLLAGILTFFTLVFLYCFCVITNFLWLFGASPSLNEIMHPKPAMASEIYSADGKLLGKYFEENRSLVDYDAISPVFFDALVSTEDERFYKHHGIDYVGIFAAAKDAAMGHPRGASTITQQLVKNIFKMRTGYGTGLIGKIPGMHMLVVKSKEMILAVGLELFYSKQEILTMYANTVDFGSNAYGIKTAAQTYFNTSPKKLKTEEAAVLVGLLKATSAYNPRINPKNSLNRRNTVLENMQNNGKLTAQACDSIKKLPIKLQFRPEKNTDGEALYFRRAVVDYIRSVNPDIDVYRDGLKIYTTLDSRMQKYAEEALREQMHNVQKTFNAHWRGLGDPWRDETGAVIPNFVEDVAKRTDAYKRLAALFPDEPDSVNYYMNLPHKVKLFDYEDGTREEEMSTMDSIRYMLHFMHAGFVAMEPHTGHVKAWVGDIDYETWKYDKVKSMRQPGSTFKLFVYATALQQGHVPSDCVRDEYLRIKVYDAQKKDSVYWQPHNANGHFSNARIPLRSAFAQSINTVAVKLGLECGIENVIQTAHDMGIISPLDTIPSLSLGASDVNLLELVDAYACAANYGIRINPVLVTKIVDSEGNTIYEAKPEEYRAVSEETAFYLQKLFEAGARDAGGTSQSLGASRFLGSYNGKIDFGGKTGTSNAHSDAWFVGVTPHLVGGAWVGGEYRSIHFRTGRLGQGSKTALPIFGLFMNKVLSDENLANRYLVRYQGMGYINPSDYNASYYVPDSLDVDSISTDTLRIEKQAEETEIPQEGTEEGNA